MIRRSILWENLWNWNQGQQTCHIYLCDISPSRKHDLKAVVHCPIRPDHQSDFHILHINTLAPLVAVTGTLQSEPLVRSWIPSPFCLLSQPDLQLSWSLWIICWYHASGWIVLTGLVHVIHNICSLCFLLCFLKYASCREVSSLISQWWGMTPRIDSQNSWHSYCQFIRHIIRFQ